MPCGSTTRIDTDLYVCPFICSSHWTAICRGNTATLPHSAQRSELTSRQGQSRVLSGLFQPNIGRHQIESCIHDTVRLLSHKQSLISDHRDCRPTQTRVWRNLSSNLIIYQQLSTEKMLAPIWMNAAMISEIYELGQGQSINIVRPVPA